jgi:hypothetical protein
MVSPAIVDISAATLRHIHLNTGETVLKTPVTGALAYPENRICGSSAISAMLTGALEKEEKSWERNTAVPCSSPENKWWEARS